MKRMLIFLILLIICPSAYTYSLKDFDNYIEMGSGYSKGYIHLYGKDLNLQGPNITITTESKLKTNPSYSHFVSYSWAFTNLESSSFIVNDDMLNQDLNAIFSTRQMLEMFLGNINYLKLNDDNKLYFSYGVHSNLITLECPQLLWLLFDIGFFTGVGIKSQISNNIFLNLNYKVAIDFITLYFSDYYFTDEFNESLSPSDTFYGTNSIATLSFVIKI